LSGQRLILLAASSTIGTISWLAMVLNSDPKASRKLLLLEK
jgi:hypothetical protein